MARPLRLEFAGALYHVTTPGYHVTTPGDWPWSSYRATVGEAPAPEFLETDGVLRAFAEDRTAAVAGYRRFVAEGIGAASPWQVLKSQIYLGSDQFVERMQARIDPKRPLREVPKRLRRALAKPLADYAARWSDRDRAMAEAYDTGAYSMQAIAEYYGVSRMTVSRAVKRHEDAVAAHNNVTCETPALLLRGPERRQVTASC